jgi:hypothetical protein
MGLAAFLVLMSAEFGLGAVLVAGAKGLAAQMAFAIFPGHSGLAGVIPFRTAYALFSATTPECKK